MLLSPPLRCNDQRDAISDIVSGTLKMFKGSQVSFCKISTISQTFPAC